MALLGLFSIVFAAGTALAAVSYEFRGVAGFAAAYGSDGSIVDLQDTDVFGLLTLDEALFTASAGEFTSGDDGSFNVQLRFERAGVTLFEADYGTVAGASSAAIRLDNDPDAASFSLSRASSIDAASLSLFLDNGDEDFLSGAASLPATIVFNSGAALDSFFDVLVTDGVSASGNFRVTSVGAVAAAVPDPATWSMFIVGFALIGGGLRRRARPALAHG